MNSLFALLILTLGIHGLFHHEMWLELICLALQIITMLLFPLQAVLLTVCDGIFNVQVPLDHPNLILKLVINFLVHPQLFLFSSYLLVYWHLLVVYLILIKELLSLIVQVLILRLEDLMVRGVLHLYFLDETVVFNLLFMLVCCCSWWHGISVGDSALFGLLDAAHHGNSLLGIYLLELVQ